MGFVAAGLELAQQVREGEIPEPDRLYVAAGTLGTAAGLAIGLAVAGSKTTVHAVRVSDRSIANTARLDQLIAKTVLMMRRLDPSVPDDLANQTRIVLRDLLTEVSDRRRAL